MKDYSGTILNAAADCPAPALRITVKADDGTVLDDWYGLNPAIAREGLAVALTALTLNGR